MWQHQLWLFVWTSKNDKLDFICELFARAKFLPHILKCLSTWGSCLCSMDPFWSYKIYGLWMMCRWPKAWYCYPNNTDRLCVRLWPNPVSKGLHMNLKIYSWFHKKKNKVLLIGNSVVRSSDNDSSSFLTTGWQKIWG